MKFNCTDCELGLQFETEEELKNHKRKFCTGSGYADVARLDLKLADLRAGKDRPIKQDRAGLKEYLSGGERWAQPVDAHQAEVAAYATPQAERQSRKLDANSLLERAEKLEHDLKANRQKQHMQNQDVMNLLADLGQRKERELRAQIEKEEIARSIKNQGKQELGALGVAKQRELEKLAADREAVRIKEQNLMDEVAKMETQLLQQESYFNQQRTAANEGDPTLRAASMRTLKEKELAWAAERAGQVAKIKNERDRLERERDSIMKELERGADARAGSRTGFRSNGAARQAGSALAFEKPPSGYGPRQQLIEPSLQDKLVADQVKLNKLRADQRLSQQNQLLDVNDIDVLQREIDGQPKYLDGISQLQNDYAQRQDPNQAEYLGVIRRRLETEAAGPRSQAMNPTPGAADNQKDAGILGKLDDLERLLLRGDGQTGKQMNIQEFPSQYQSSQQIPPQPIAPASVDLRSSLPQGLPLNPQQFGYGQPTQWAPPQAGFPGQTLDSAFPQAGQDPALTQLASMLQNQDSENRKLREVLENFGKNASTQEELGDVVNNTNQQLQQLGGAAAFQPFQGKQELHKPRSGKEDTTQSPQDASRASTVFPDEFLFRQNEERSADLEVEERALMNLAAQEYDQLRVIQRLPKDSDLYAYKLQQYKELSAMRAEVEKVLQEQRLEKIKRDFERQKVDEERQLRHQQWLEHQKRQILEGRVGADGGSPSQQYVSYDRPPVQPKAYRRSEDSQGSSLPLPAAQIATNSPQPRARPVPQQDQDLNASVGALVQLDYAFALPRQVRQLKVVFSAFTAQGAIGQPGLSGPSAAEPETYNKNLNKVFLGTRQLFTQIPANTQSRIIFELQAVDQAQPSGFAGVGWTWVDLFKGQDSALWSGRWCLPVYAGATRPELTATGGAGLEQAPGIALCLRLGPPADPVFEGRANHLTTQADYVVHPNHVRGLKQPAVERQQSVVPRQPSQIQKSPSIRPAKRPTRDPRYRCQGVRLRFHFVQQRKHYEKLTLRVSLYEGEAALATQANGEPCEAQAPTVPDSTALAAAKGSSVTVEPNGQVKVEAGVAGPERQLKSDAVIRPLGNFEFVWDRDFFNSYWDGDRQKPFILVIEVFGRPRGAQGGREAVAFATFDIADREDGKLRYGQHVVPLFVPPITFTANEREEIENESIFFSLLDPSVHRQSLAAGGVSQSIVAPQEPALLAQPSLRPATPPESEMSEQFVPNFDKQYTISEKWLPTSGLDIYIDGTRHLPDNSSMTKLTVRIVDSDLKAVLPPEVVLADIAQSSTRNQRFNFQTELRLKKVKPTALVYMTFETVDISHNQPRLIGHSYFPLFIDGRQGMPATVDSATQISPHLGRYQMPIYWARVKEETPFTYERFVYLERVPTASVLIRILKAPEAAGKPISTKGLPAAERQSKLVPAPAYHDGVYSTQYFQCSDDEKHVMTLRRLRPDAPMETAVARLLQAQGKDASEMSADQQTKFLNDLIKTNKKSALIDLDYHAQYEPSLGVRINVEAIHDNKAKGLLAVLASIIPPASYYDANRAGPLSDAFAFSELDFNSTMATQKFNEGDASVLGFKPQQPGMSVLFDVKIYSPETDSFADYGFALAPLLQGLDTDADSGNLEFYVNSGVFTLPIYKGKISEQIVNQIKATQEPLKLLADMLARKEIEYLPTASVIAKIVDSQRKLHFRESFEKRPPSTRFVDPKLVSKYAYQPITGGLFGSAPKKLHELVPAAKRKNLAGFIQEFTTKFSAYMKL